MRSSHCQSLVPCHWLSGEVAQRKVDGVGLGSKAESVHDQLDVCVLDLDVRPHSAHTPNLHVTCTTGVHGRKMQPRSGYGVHAVQYSTKEHSVEMSRISSTVRARLFNNASVDTR